MTKNYGRDDLMAVAAFRYSLGRMTYIVSDCAHWLLSNGRTSRKTPGRSFSAILRKPLGGMMKPEKKVVAIRRSATTATGRNGKKYGGCGNDRLSLCTTL